MTDLELMKILDENGYDATAENLMTLKEGLESGEYEIITESDYSDYDLYQILEDNGYDATAENLEILKEGLANETYIIESKVLTEEEADSIQPAIDLLYEAVDLLEYVDDDYLYESALTMYTNAREYLDESVAEWFADRFGNEKTDKIGRRKNAILRKGRKAAIKRAKKEEKEAEKLAIKKAKKSKKDTIKSIKDEKERLESALARAAKSGDKEAIAAAETAFDKFNEKNHGESNIKKIAKRRISDEIEAAKEKRSKKVSEKIKAEEDAYNSKKSIGRVIRAVETNSTDKKETSSTDKK